MSTPTSAWQRWLQDDGTPAGQARRPEYRHGTAVPMQWSAIAFNPVVWKAGHWAMFGALLTAIADMIAALYIANFLGVGRQFEISMWLLIAGVVGFVSMTAAVWAIWKRQARTVAVWALAISLALGAVPAWLVGNTFIQLIATGGKLVS